MSFRIEKGECLAAAFGRIAAEEITLAETELGHADQGASVHNARKALKRLRALLRSLRVVFPRELFRAENRRIAEAGRKISPLRDLHVQLCTLGKLKAANNPVGHQVQRDLLRRQTSFSRRIPALRTAVRSMLAASRQSMTGWPLREATSKRVAAGLKRIYKQGRKSFKLACDSPTPAHLHEWRKRAKSLGYGLELVKDLVPAKLRRMVDCIDELTEALGDDHDLFLVFEAIRREHKVRPAVDFAPLARRIQLKRTRLQKRAFKLGDKIYSRKTGGFGQRLDRCLRRVE